jgi:hypothetical protein
MAKLSACAVDDEDDEEEVVLGEVTGLETAVEDDKVDASAGGENGLRTISLPFAAPLVEEGLGLVALGVMLEEGVSLLLLLLLVLVPPTNTVSSVYKHGILINKVQMAERAAIPIPAAA